MVFMTHTVKVGKRTSAREKQTNEWGENEREAVSKKKKKSERVRERERRRRRRKRG